MRGLFSMKKIYCKKCGYKIFDSDTEYCPRCGSRVNDYAEVKSIEKSRKTRKILLTILVIVVIASILLLAGATINKQSKEFKTYNFSNTCSIELPSWIHFNDADGAANINSQSNIAGSNVQTNSKSLFGNNEISQITYSKSVVDGQAVGANLNDISTTNINGKTIYTRTVMSEETGESVSIIGENKTLVDYMAEHVKFNGKNGTNAGNDTSKSSSKNIKNVNNDNNPIVGYLGDGTPVHKNDYTKLSKQEPIYNFNPNIGYYDGQPYYIDGDRYVDGSGSGSLESGGSSQGGGSSEGGGAAST